MSGINKTVNFQGKLVGNNGLNVADGNYTVVFTLYDASSNGNNLWDETQTVSTVDGIFQVALGSVDTSLGSVNFNSDSIYLGIKVGADSEMTPRIRFGAVPYAFNAEKLSGVTASQSATGFTFEGGTSSKSSIAFTTAAGLLTLQPGVAGGLTIQSNGANGLTLDTGGAAALNIGNTNATSLVLGSSAVTGLTVTTDGTGNGEVVLPGQSIGAAEVLNNTLDYGQFADSQTLDADTTVSLNAFNNILDLTSTGEFFIRDAGNNFAQFLADGTITLGKAASSGSIDLGIGTGADTINLGTNNTVGDTLAIGNNNASTTLALTGGDDWSITTAGAANFASVTGAGLADCDSATSKILWNDASGQFSCGTDLGSNLQVADFTDNTTEVATFATAMDIWDGTYPNISPASTNSEILISVNIRGTSDDANDQNPVFIIRRAIGSNPVCTGGTPSTAVGGEFAAGGLLTAASQDWGVSVTTSDAPASTGNVRYTVCTTANGTDDGNTDEVRVVLTEIGSSSAAGGGGNVSVRETDSSPSVATASTIEFGPDSTSSDEFIVEDRGSGVARIRLGDQVGLLNQAEIVTGGWTFNTADTTFTTALSANGGINTSAVNQNLSLSVNGTGDFILNTDSDSSVGIGTTSPLATLDVRGNVGTSPIASFSAQTAYAGFVLDNSGTGDIFTASSSGVSQFVIRNGGQVGIGTVLPSAMLDVAGTASISSALTFRANGGGTVQTTNRQTLTLGSSTTGNIVINPYQSVIVTPSANTATAFQIQNAGGAVLFNADTNNNRIGIGTSTPLTTLDVRGTSGTLPGASVSAQSAFAALLVDNSGTGDLFTASKSGVPTFTITNTGALRASNYQTAGGILYANSNGTFLQTTPGNTGECLKSAAGSAPTWGSCGVGGGGSNWDIVSGAIMPKTASTLDFLIGGTASSSAKFGVLNVNSGTPTATLSATATGYALSLTADGSITTTQGKTLTLGGGDSGEVYSASTLRLDSSKGIKGGGLSDCDNPATAKLLWDSSTSRFSCGTDQGGGEGSSMTVRESDSSPAVSAVAVLEFGPGSTSSDEFIVTDEGSGIARVRAGNQLGMLNQAETVTGGWTFNTGTTTFTTGIFANGGLNTTANTDLSLAAGGSGDIVFTTDADTGVSIGSSANTPAPLSVSGGIGNNAAFIINQTNSGNIFAASSAGQTKFVVDGSGNLLLSAGAISDSSDGVDINDDLDVSGAINLTSNNLAFSSTGSITLAGGTLSDSEDGVDINDDLDVAQNINIAGSTGITFSSTGGIILANGTISDTSGDVDINDDLTVSGTTGLTFSGSGADITFANSEQISNDTNGTITFGRNDAGTVFLNARDNDSTAALDIKSGGAATLNFDTGGTAGLTIGTGNASSVTIGNTTNGTSVSINSGTGGLNFGDNANIKTIEIGGVDNDGGDTISIGTNATSADTITIGNGKTDTTMALTGGDDWSITNNGAASFSTGAFSGQISASNNGIEFTESDSNPACASGNYTIFADTSEGKLKKCQNGVATDLDTAGSDSQRASTSLAFTTITTSSTYLGQVSITPSTNTGDVTVRAFVTTNSNSNTNQTITAEIRTASGTTCGGSLLASETAALEAASGSNGPSLVVTQFTVDAGTSTRSYAVCASTTTSNGADAEGTVTAEVIDTGADLAEFYTTNDSSIEAGDVVSGDQTLKAGIKKTTSAYQKDTFGIVSTFPALTIGNVTKEGVNAVPIALSGRVPVKVSSESGPIKPGDFLTSSSTPGVAMKATKSGATLGVAMENFSGDGIGKVMMFVKNDFFTGSPILEFVSGTGDTANDVNVLQYFLDQKEMLEKSSALSEFVTDRLAAGLEIVTPRVITDELEARIITVDKIIAKEIEIPAEAWEQAFKDGGLEALEARIEKQESRIASLEQMLQTYGSNTFIVSSSSAGQASSPTASISVVLPTIPELPEDHAADVSSDSGKMLVKRLQVTGSALIEGVLHVVDFLTARNLIVDELATFFGDVVFKGDVLFSGRPAFNNDTAGIAVVKKGSDRVEVRFSKEYDSAPMISANLTLDEISPIPSEVLENLNKRQEELELRAFKSNIRYIITKRSTEGFVIVIDKPVVEDTAFSWIAIAVDNPRLDQGNPVVSVHDGDNPRSIEGQFDKSSQTISSTIPSMIPASSMQKGETKILPSPMEVLEREEVSDHESN